MIHRMTKIFALLITLSMIASPVSAVVAAGPVEAPLAAPALAEADSPAGESPAGASIYLIRLADAPLAAYRGGVPGLAATSTMVTGERKLDVDSPDSQAYLAFLDAQQASFISAMNTALGRQVEVVHQYKYANNGMAVRLTKAEADLVAGLPAVIFMQPDFERELQTEASVPMIGAPEIWAGLGSLPATMGEGIIIGVIDTGVTWQNPSFAEVGPVDGYVHTNPWGPGVYAGNCEVGSPNYQDICNDKLIGAFGYPGNGNDARDYDGHGSHTSSIAGGNFVDITDPITVTISGVAPHANIVSFASCCAGSDLSASIDDAIAVGVDAINYSIGSASPSNVWNDFDTVGYLNAREAGIFVATSAGNNGPGPDTVGSPADAPWLTAVGGNNNSRINGLLTDVTGPVPVPVELTDLGVVNGGDSPEITQTIAAEIRFSDLVDPGNELGCDPFPAGVFDNAIALIRRGDCNFSVKQANAGDAGAIAMVVFNHSAGPPIVMGALDPNGIHSVFMGIDDGEAVRDWIIANDPTPSTFAIYPGEAPVYNDDWAKLIYASSSRGSNRALPDIVKPDVIAPAVNVLAAYGTYDDIGYEFLQGTSMASPHVAGTAALFMVLHPDWTPAEIQSALMTTGLLDIIIEDGVTPAGPFDIGGGRITLPEAAQAGLILDESIDNYWGANPAIGGDPKSLNLASLGNGSCVGTCVWERTVKSALSYTQSWTVTVDTPPTLTMEIAPSFFTLDPGMTQTLVITANVVGAPLDVWQFGYVVISPTVGAPLAQPVAGTTPASYGTPNVPSTPVASPMIGQRVGINAGPSLLYAPSEDDDPAFRAAVAALTGGIVDYYDARAGTPTLPELQAYDGVLTWANFTYLDNVAFGDVLADYVDGGGLVILSAFTTYTSGNYLSGRIMTDPYAPVYSPSGNNHFLDSTYAGDGTTFLHDGVSTYTCLFRDYLTLQGTGAQDGSYLDGEIAASYRPDFKVIHMNGINAVQLGCTGDYPIIVANALLYAGGPPPAAHFAVAVRPATAALPDLVTIVTDQFTGTQTIFDVQVLSDVTDLTTEVFGMGLAQRTEADLYQDPTNGNPYDNLDDVLVVLMDVPADALRLVAEVSASEAPDLDLFVGTGDTPSAATQVCSSAGGSWTEYCNIAYPAAGTWWVVLQNWSGSTEQPDHVVLQTGVVENVDAGNLTVTGPSSVPGGQLFDLDLNWDEPSMLGQDYWYAVFSVGTDSANPGNLGYVDVNLQFIGERVFKSGPDTAETGEEIAYTIQLEFPSAIAGTAMLTDVLPLGVEFVSGTLTATFGTAWYDAADNAVYWNNAAGMAATAPASVPSGDRIELSLSGVPSEGTTAEAPSVPDAYVDLVLDDGSVENNIGIGGTWEMIFLNRFTPDAGLFPFNLDEIQVYFSGGTANVNPGDNIILVVYQDADGNPGNGADWLGSFPTTVQAVDAWNVYTLGSPVYVTGPGDVLVGVIGMETPGSAYFPAALDQTATQNRSWAGWWTVSPPPNPPTLPPDDTFGIIDSFGFPGNWMVRGYGSEPSQATPSMVTINFSATVTAGPSSVVTNTAWLNYNGDLTYGETVLTVPGADLEVSKMAPASVYVGDIITYTIDVANNGLSDATGVVITDVLPAGVTYMSSSTGCMEAGGVVNCLIGELANGASVPITIVVAAPATAGVITNTVEVYGDPADPDMANNMATAETTVVAFGADLSVTKMDDPDPVYTSATLTYTLVVVNNGPNTAVNVMLTDTLPAGVTFVTTSHIGCAEDAGIVTCDLGDLTSSEGITLSITVLAPDTAGTITNMAEVSSDTLDPDTTDNAASEDTEVMVSGYWIYLPIVIRD